MSSEDECLYRCRARHGKEDGTCDITARGVRWWNGSGSVWVPWASVDKHEVSPQSHSRAMLKISRKTDTKPVILTMLEANRERAYSNLMQAKETISVVLKRQRKAAKNRRSSTAAAADEATSTKAKVDDGDDLPLMESSAAVEKQREEAQRRRAELSVDKRLEALYRELVGGGVMDEATFWATRGDDSSEEKKREQKKSLSNALLVDAPSSRSSTKVTYSLNREKQDYVFTMYPAVKRAHEVLVVTTGKMSEAQFWVKYFQSKYFQRDKGAAVLRAKRVKARNQGEEDLVADDLFARFEEEPHHQAMREKPVTSEKNIKERVVSKAVDVSKTQFDEKAHRISENDEPATEEPKGPVAPRASLLVQKFNRHADLVVKATVEPRENRNEEEDNNNRSIIEPKPSFQPLFVDDFRHPDFSNAPQKRTQEKKRQRPPIAWDATQVDIRGPLDAAPAASQAAFAFLDRKSKRAHADDRPEEPFRSLAEEKASLTLELLRLLHHTSPKSTHLPALRARLAALGRDLHRISAELRDQSPEGATQAAILKPLRDQIDLALSSASSS